MKERTNKQTDGRLRRTIWLINAKGYFNIPFKWAANKLNLKSRFVDYLISRILYISYIFVYLYSYRSSKNMSACACLFSFSRFVEWNRNDDFSKKQKVGTMLWTCLSMRVLGRFCSFHSFIQNLELCVLHKLIMSSKSPLHGAIRNRTKQNYNSLI